MVTLFLVFPSFYGARSWAAGDGHVEGFFLLGPLDEGVVWGGCAVQHRFGSG